MSTLVVRGPARIEGATHVPGDKSISHRALMLGALAHGKTRITGLAPGADVTATRGCLEGFGVELSDDAGTVFVHGAGRGSWSAPARTLDCANSGTTMRLIAGLAAHHVFETCLDGDESLRRRPMDRIAGPLRALGARVETTHGRFPPLSVRGGALRGTAIDTGVASAQVKSCALLAGLAAEGETVVREPARTRDHTERMLGSLGAPITTRSPNGTVEIVVRAFEPPPFEIDVPGDPSSASFLVGAALLCGRVRLDDVCLNPTRTAFFETCARMGGVVRSIETQERNGEPIGHIEAEQSVLHGTGVEGPIVPQLIDELPLLAVLATSAEGTTTVSGAGELRVKESDRITAIATGLRAMGADIAEREDGFEVRGGTVLRGATVDAAGDHRIAMALAVAGLCADGETRVTGFEAAAVSWPGFHDVLTGLGADVEVVA